MSTYGLTRLPLTISVITSMWTDSSFHPVARCKVNVRKADGTPQLDFNTVWTTFSNLVLE